MATHSSIHVWKIPWTKEPGRIQSLHLQRVRQNLWINNKITNEIINFSFLLFVSNLVCFSSLSFIWLVGWSCIVVFSYLGLGLFLLCRLGSMKRVSPLFSFSCLVAQLCLTLWDPMNTRLPCPPPTPRACSNSCPWSRWYHPPISSSVIPFSCLQSFPTSGKSQFFASCSQSIGASASASVLPMNIRDWYPLGLNG